MTYEEKMYCLSVRQPWASAIFEEKKLIENRTWTTGYRGILIIHSSGLYDPDYARSEEFATCAISKSFTERVKKKVLPVGEVLGVVELYDIVRDSTSLWARDACFHFKLRNARLLSQPVKARGNQKLWAPSDKLRRLVLAGL